MIRGSLDPGGVPSQVNDARRWCVSLAALCVLGLARVATGQPAPFSVSWHPPTLSVTAANADIVSVLESVREQTGLEIQGLDRLTQLPASRRMISASFENLSLADGVHSLMTGFSYGLIQFLEPRPGTLGIVLVVSHEPGPAQRREDEGDPGDQRGAVVVVRTESESDVPITPAAHPDSVRVPSTPSMRPDEFAANGVLNSERDPNTEGPRLPSVTVSVYDASGTRIATPAASGQPGVSSSTGMRPDERAAQESAERRQAEGQKPERPKTTKPQKEVKKPGGQVPEESGSEA